jgi:hypothetical protein
MTRILGMLGAVVLAAVLASPVLAAGTWSDSGIQWATNKPFTLAVVDHTRGSWPALIAVSAADWSASGTADVVVGGNGRIKVTISDIASLTAPCGWTTVSLSNGHLKSAAITVNDLCNVPQIVICQEIGHALGMPDHRTDVPSAPSCMAPAWYGPHPTQDDLDELASLYQ